MADTTKPSTVDKPAETKTPDKAPDAGPGAGTKAVDPMSLPKLTDDTSPVVVAEGSATERFGTKAGDVPDPRTGDDFTSPSAGLAGISGLESVDAVAAGTIPNVDPDHIPAEVTPGVTPAAGGDALLAAAQAKAPSLTREFVDAYKLTDSDLGAIARGEVPPPPTPGPVHTSDLYLTPGGWQSTPPGVPPQDVGKNAITRG